MAVSHEFVVAVSNNGRAGLQPHTSSNIIISSVIVILSIVVSKQNRYVFRLNNLQKESLSFIYARLHTVVLPSQRRTLWKLDRLCSFQWNAYYYTEWIMRLQLYSKERFYSYEWNTPLGLCVEILITDTGIQSFGENL